MVKKMDGLEEVTESQFLSDLEESMEEFIPNEDGKVNVDSRVTMIDSAPLYKAEDIKRIRRKNNYSQKVLASILNVSIRTVQNWEISKAKPSGSAFRLLELLDKTSILSSIIKKTR